MCSIETCKFCCIVDSEGVSNCVDDILRCRFKTNVDFTKIAVFIMLLTGWIYFLPLFFKLLENFFLKRVYKNKSCCDLIFSFISKLFKWTKRFKEKKKDKYKSETSNIKRPSFQNSKNIKIKFQEKLLSKKLTLKYLKNGNN